MTSVAKETGLGRESLYKAFSGNAKPEFETVRKVIQSSGLKLVAEPIETKESSDAPRAGNRITRSARTSSG
jgi:DNA-binding phage protein